MNSTAAPAPAPRGRTQFLLLAMLFFFPLLGSYVLYFYFPQYRPSGTTNYGELVNPAQPLPALQFVDAQGKARDGSLFLGRWTYVVTAGADCDDLCLRKLIMVRQVRLAMNEKRSRVQRVLVLQDPSAVARVAAGLAAQHPDLQVLGESQPAGQRLSDFLQPANAAAHLIDPHGNWLMHYREGREIQDDFKGMQKDLGKLLRLSQIG